MFGESVMHPRGALCGCCENNLLWGIETVIYMAVGVKWAGPGFRVFLRGFPRGSSCGIGRLLIVISMCDRSFPGFSGCSFSDL